MPHHREDTARGVAGSVLALWEGLSEEQQQVHHRYVRPFFEHFKDDLVAFRDGVDRASLCSEFRSELATFRMMQLMSA